MRTKQQTLKLIKGLRKAANLIESGKIKHSWSDTSRCNCGALAKCLLTTKEYERIPQLAGQWSRVVHRLNKIEDIYEDTCLPNINNGWGSCGLSDTEYCRVSDMLMKDVIKVLTQNGMEFDDFENLEFLRDEEILERAEIKKSTPEHGEEYYRDKENVIKYMRTWAKMLCEEQCELKEANAKE